MTFEDGLTRTVEWYLETTGKLAMAERWASTGDGPA